MRRLAKLSIFDNLANLGINDPRTREGAARRTPAFGAKPNIGGSGMDVAGGQVGAESHVFDSDAPDYGINTTLPMG